MTPFFITGLPRSRTAWMANFLTWGNSFCHHDALRLECSVAGLRKQIERCRAWYVGDSDSGLMWFAEDIVKAWPDARWVLIRRPMQECLESYQNYFPRHPYPGIPVLKDADALTVFHEMEKISTRVTQHVPMGNLSIVQADGLDDENVMRAMWDWVLPGILFPVERWRMLNTMNVRIISEKVEAPGVLGCKFNPVSSRVCGHGTKCCEAEH